jgi:hypothetical protein
MHVHVLYRCYVCCGQTIYVHVCIMCIAFINIADGICLAQSVYACLEYNYC